MHEALALIPNRAHLEAVETEGREAWLAARRLGIGSSEIAAICGVSPWSSPLQVYREKVGQMPDRPPTWKMKIGTATEDLILTTWAEAARVTLYRLPLLVDTRHPHRRANLDRLGILGGAPLVVEGKWSGEKAETAPPHYQMQVVWQEEITGIPAGSLVAANDWDEPSGISVPYDSELAAAMVEVADRFWIDHVLARVEPAPTTPEERRAWAFDRLRGKVAEVQATPEVEALIRHLAQAKEEVKTAKAAEEAADAALAQAMGELGAARLAGPAWKASRVEVVNGQINWARAAQENLATEVLERYRGEGYSYLRVAPVKARR